jgi:chromosome segregation ATPase
MSDRPDNSDRLETMLRAWGAQRAMERPAVEAPRARRRAELAVAAALAVAVGVVSFYGGTRFSQRPAPVVAMPADTAPANPELQSARDALARYQRVVRGLEDRVAQQERLIEAAASAPAGATEHEAALAAVAAELKDVLSQSHAMSQQVEALQREREALRGREEALRATLARESAEWRRQLDAEQAQAARLRSELDVLAGRHAALMGQFQQAYLSAAGSGATGLAARQAALRHSRLLERLPALRRAATDDGTRQLLDRIEAILTRMDMLPADASSAEVIARMVDRGRVIAGVDGVLAAADALPELRVWMLEARMILAEVNRA